LSSFPTGEDASPSPAGSPPSPGSPPPPGFRRPGAHAPLRPFAPGQRRPYPPNSDGPQHGPQDGSHQEQLTPSGHFEKFTPVGHAERPLSSANGPIPSAPPAPVVEEPIEPVLPGQPTSFCEDGTLARCERRCANGAPLPCAPGNEPACFCRDGSTPARATSVLSQRLRPAPASPQRSDQPVSLAESFQPSRPADSGDFIAG
jgi:hypothetical protein